MTAATRILRISRTVADLDRASAFHRDALGFACGPAQALDDPALLHLLGLPAIASRACALTLGAQTIELVAFAPPGNAYPSSSDAASPWFQHCAIVVRDMDAAYARLCAHGGFAPISQGGPQTLPPGNGGVTAFKFRDPDGHPLELLRFPADSAPAAWRNVPGQHSSLGIDHSAIVVQDQTRSLAFYTGLLGLAVGERSRNVGAAQQRLDGLAADLVDVIALYPAAQATPHLELLAYLTPAPDGETVVIRADDLAATRLVLEVDGLAATIEILDGAGVRFVSPGMTRLRDGSSAALVRDPDGHAVMLIEPAAH